MIPVENDGKVARTKLEDMKDHIAIRASHMFPYNKKVQKQTLHFLEYGNFDH
jgi:hypothetical protein